MAADLANKEGLVNEDNLWREDNLPGPGVRKQQFSECDHTKTFEWAAKCYGVLNTMYHEHHSTAEGSLHEIPLKYNQYTQEFHCLLGYSIKRLLIPAVSVLKEQLEKSKQLPAERKPCQTSFQTRLRVLEAKVDYLDSQIQNHLIPGQALSWSRPLLQLFLLILARLRGIRDRQDQLNRQMVLEYPDCISNHPDERATIFNGTNGKLMPRCAKCHGRVRRQFPPELIAQEESSRGVFKGDVCAEDNGALDCARLRAG
ncbi:hypothetical protein VMCG_10643 [Cytospora schulzeri]|uniref:Uncharacterized protein n=1 Tax=Cytospora schulzeri TaxID=448051 RepID=A0A423VB97_9PEZI|nr:hypothetical protein VMCG_10643 [Valsa malicola]